MPSTMIRWRLLAATSITPTIIAISKPPNAASTSTGSVDVAVPALRALRIDHQVRQRVRRSCCGPLTRAGRAPARRSGATAPAPRFRASRRRCRRRPAGCRAACRRSPCRRGSPHAPGRATSRRPTRALRVPWAILRIISRSCGGNVSATPQSTTVRSMSLDAREHRHRQLAGEQLSHLLVRSCVALRRRRCRRPPGRGRRRRPAAAGRGSAASACSASGPGASPAARARPGCRWSRCAAAACRAAPVPAAGWRWARSASGLADMAR